MISIKSNRELDLMRQSGKIVALCHEACKTAIRPGITTNELNDIVEKIIKENDAIPAFLNYNGFPKSICSSVNEVVIHGIPDDVPLKEGDIVSIDIGVKYKGYYGDSAWTYPVGKISEEAEFLLKETETALFIGLEKLKDGVHLGEVSSAIGNYVSSKKLGNVRDFAGHGVGNSLHEAPEIVNYATAKKGPVLRSGMTMAIEPMLTLGTDKVQIDQKDGWTVRTKDKSLSAHFEHTIVVTNEGYEILTKL